MMFRKLLSYKPVYGVLNHEKFKQRTLGKSKVKTFLLETWEVMYRGSADTFRDGRIMIEHQLSKKKTALQLQEIVRIRNDLLKFIPFSFFLVIPGAELLLPPYLYLFPNAFPTTYLFDDKLERRWITKDRKQMNSQRFLFQLIKLRLPQVENIRNNQEYQPKHIQKLILENTDILQRQLYYKNMNSEQLVHLCKFLGMEFFRGTYTVMKLTRLFINLDIHFTNLYYFITRNPERKVVRNVLKNWNIKLPFPLEDLKRWLLIFQIKNHLKRCSDQDKAFRDFGFDDQTFETMRTFARERGMTASMIQKERTVSDLDYAKMCFKRDWIDFTHKEQVFENMKIWYAILYYERFHRRIREEHEERVQKKQIKIIDNPTNLYQKGQNFIQSALGLAIQGSKAMKNDFFFYRQIRTQQNKSCDEIFESYRIIRDFKKIIPYGILVALPLTYLIIPAYIALFPNGIPSQFQFIEQNQEIQDQSQKISNESAQKLIELFKLTQFQNLRSVEDIQKTFLNNRELFDHLLNIDQMNEEQLILICRFFQMEYMVYTLLFKLLANLFLNAKVHILNLYNWKFKPQQQQLQTRDYFVNVQLPIEVQEYRKKQLRNLIRLHIKQIRDQDEQFQQSSDQIVSKLSAFRGLKDLKTKKNYKQIWIDFIQKHNIRDEELIWYALLTEYNIQQFTI
ncbi:hypothetical protein pb186bvf_001489 [Paramecium bursaria]